MLIQILFLSSPSFFQRYLLSIYDVPNAVWHAISFNPPRNYELGKLLSVAELTESKR